MSLLEVVFDSAVVLILLAIRVRVPPHFQDAWISKDLSIFSLVVHKISYMLSFKYRRKHYLTWCL